MDDWLVEELSESYPVLYKYHDEDVARDELGREPPISRGVQCDDGWYWMIDAASNVIEQWVNGRDDEDDVHVTQIKEKFGGLRFYTETDNSFVFGVVRLLEELSGTVCEVCGEMETAKPRSGTGHHITLCEPCFRDIVPVADETDIWKFEMECFNCGEQTPVVYPEEIGGHDGGTWNEVGDVLSEKEYCNIERTYSDVQQVDVWGNLCVECGAYQGNHYVYKAASELLHEHGHEEVDGEFEIVDTVKCGLDRD